jgi:hypothetical protein
MNIMRRISKEYNEPFVDVVKGFAAMRFGKSETARTLGMSVVWFNKLCTRFDLHKHFYPISELKEGTWPGKPGVNKKHDSADILRDVRKYPTYTEFKNNSDIPAATVYRRFGDFENARRLSNG